MALPEPVPLVRTDLACRRCGYNLRTLPVDKHCPECGTSIEWSLKGWKLRYANPLWLVQLNSGCNAMVAACALLILFTALLFFSMLPHHEQSFTYPILTLALIIQLLMLRGLWLLTTPEPFVEPDKPHSFRRLVRIVGTSLLILAVVLVVRHLAPNILVIRLWNTLFADSWVAVPAALIALLLLLKYAGFIVQRSPESGLEDGVRACFAAIILMLLVGLPALFFVAMAGGMAGIVITFLCVLPVVLLGQAIMLLVVFSSLSRELSRLARADRESD